MHTITFKRRVEDVAIFCPFSAKMSSLFFFSKLKHSPSCVVKQLRWFGDWTIYSSEVPVYDRKIGARLKEDALSKN
jgi:hypothetical protein